MCAARRFECGNGKNLTIEFAQCFIPARDMVLPPSQSAYSSIRATSFLLCLYAASGILQYQLSLTHKQSQYFNTKWWSYSTPCTLKVFRGLKLMGGHLLTNCSQNLCWLRGKFHCRLFKHVLTTYYYLSTIKVNADFKIIFRFFYCTGNLVLFLSVLFVRPLSIRYTQACAHRQKMVRKTMGSLLV